MGRLSTTISKDFFLSPEWVADNAIRLDDFCASVAQNTPAIRTGTYIGNGLTHTITVGDLPQSPILVLLQNAGGGTPFLTLVPSIGSSVIALTRNGFTLSPLGAYNQPNVDYQYLVVA